MSASLLFTIVMAIILIAIEIIVVQTLDKRDKHVPARAIAVCAAIILLISLVVGCILKPSLTIADGEPESATIVAVTDDAVVLKMQSGSYETVGKSIGTYAPIADDLKNLIAGTTVDIYYTKDPISGEKTYTKAVMTGYDSNVSFDSSSAEA